MKATASCCRPLQLLISQFPIHSSEALHPVPDMSLFYLVWFVYRKWATKGTDMTVLVLCQLGTFKLMYQKIYSCYLQELTSAGMAKFKFSLLT